MINMHRSFTHFYHKKWMKPKKVVRIKFSQEKSYITFKFYHSISTSDNMQKKNWMTTETSWQKVIMCNELFIFSFVKRNNMYICITTVNPKIYIQVMVYVGTYHTPPWSGCPSHAPGWWVASPLWAELSYTQPIQK